MRTLLALLLLLPAAVAAEPRVYTVQPGDSFVEARVKSSGLAAALAHDHVVRGADLTGEIRYDPQAASALSLQVTVKTPSLEIDDPRLRHRRGLEAIDADDRAEIRKNMRSADQLAVSRHPTARFRSTKVWRVRDGRYRVSGELTVRGETREVSLPVDVKITDARFEGEGTLSVEQSDFGIEPYSAALGAVKTRDRVTLRVRLVGTR